MEKKNITIVTSLIDINRGEWNNIYQRTIEDYFYYLQHVLNLRNNFYIFIDKRYYEALDYLCKKQNNKYKLVPVSIEDLTMYKYRNKMIDIMSSKEYKENQKDPICPEVTKPEYNIVVNSKIEFLYKASLDNVFNSTYFIWLDAGFGHGNINIPRIEWYPTKLLDKNQISILCLQDVKEIDKDYHTFYNKHIDVIAGGVFSCPIELISSYYNKFYSLIDEYMNYNITDDDQYTVSMIYVKNPELFNINYVNNWKGVFDVINWK